MFTKILALILSACMLITSAPFGPAVDEIGDLVESISQKIADSVDGFVESLGQEDEDTSATTNENNEEEFVVTEQASEWGGGSSAPSVSGKTYSIESADHLAWLATQVNGGTTFSGYTFELKTDIDLKGIAWTPIGYSKAFSGIFDGKGHTITGLKAVANTSVDRCGLFGYTNAATIKNVGLENFLVQSDGDATTAGYGVGALIGYAQETTVQMCYARGSSTATSTVTSTNKVRYAGGLIGTANGTATKISHCYVQGVTVTNNVSSATCGGIVGYLNKSTSEVKYSYFAGTLSSTNKVYIGGLIGRNNVANNDCTNSYTINTYSVVGSSSETPSPNGQQKTAAELQNFGYPKTATNSYLNADSRVYYYDYGNVNGGYPVFENEYAYKALEEEIASAETFYANRGTLSGWGGISKYEVGLANTDLLGAINAAKAFINGTDTTGTAETHIAALKTAVAALNEASAKYTNASYAPTITITAPEVVELNGSTFKETTITINSTYELYPHSISVTNGKIEYIQGSASATGTGEARQWHYDYKFSGTVSNPSATGGTVTFSAKGTANGQERTATATSRYAGSAPSGQLVFDVDIVTTKGRFGWTPFADYSFVVKGLHKVNKTATQTLADTITGTGMTEKFSGGTDSTDSVGYFYYDKNSSNTLGAATGATSLQTVKFDAKCRSIASGNSTMTSKKATLSFTADNSGYIKSSLSQSFSSASSTPVTLTPVPTSPAPTAQPNPNPVKYTATSYSYGAGSGFTVSLEYAFSFNIHYIWVNSTQLWNLYNSEANTIKRLDYASFYKANDSTAWNTYVDAYLNAQTVLSGGVPQTTIDNAYTQLVNAIKGLKGKINYNKNGGAGTVTTPQYPTIYSNVTAVSTAVQAPTYTFATVTLSSYSGLTKVGYTCIGWVNSSTATTVQFPNNKLTMNATRATAAFTLYAGWVANHRVLFDINDGTSNVNLFSLDSLSKTVNGVTYTYNPSDGTITLNGTATTAPKFFEVPFTVVSGEKYRYTFDYISGSVQNGCAVVELLEHATDTPRLNLDLSNADSSKTVTIADADVPKVNRLNFRGYWNSSGTGLIFTNYKFKFKMEKASASTAQTPPGMYVAYNSTYGTLPTPTRAGYAFKGWYTAKTGGTKIESSSTITADTTVYAQWTASTYTISFNGNGNTGGSTASMSMTYGTAKNLTANGFTKTGYTFAGWNTKADGTGTGYANQQSVNNLTATNGATVTLYAQWTAKSVTITLDRVGGTGGTASVQATYGSALPDIVAPTKVGYTFAGYFADDRKTSLTSSITKGSSYARVDFKKEGNGWNLTTDGDKGRHLTAVITFVDPSCTNAPQIQFNDVNLDNSMYQIEEITNGWKYTVDFDITEEMVTARGTTLYNTNYRFIDFVCVPTSDTVITVSSATLGGNMYYDAEGKGVLVSDFATNDTLYARWTTNEYYLNIKGLLDGVEDPGLRDYATVDVYVNGVLVADDVDDYWTMHPFGSTYEIKDIKVAVGRTFVAADSTALSGTMDVAGEKTVILKFTTNTYTVSFNGNGNTGGSTASMSMTYGTAKELTANGFAKTGYTFNGWNTVADGTGDSYTDKQSVNNLTATNGATVTLYAQWTAKSVTITLDRVGGTGGTASVAATYDSGLPNITVPTKAGYTFAGYFADDRTTSLASDIIYNSSSSYARVNFKMEGNDWNLTTDGDKGRHLTAVIIFVDPSRTNAPQIQFNDVNLDNSMYQVEEITNGWKYTVDFDITEEMVTAKGSTLYNTNLRFIDFSCVPTSDTVITVSSATLGGNMYYDAEGKGVLVSDFETNDTLYARWTGNTYTIKFNGNGNTGGSTASMSMTYGTAKELTANGFTKTGYTFNGWNTVADGTGDSYTNKQSVNNLTATDGATVTLYAQWTAITYTVTFDANGGTCDTESITVAYQTPYGELPTPTRTGYIFAGWFTGQTSGNQLKPTTNYTLAKDQTIYAHWTPITYTIKYLPNGGSGSAAADEICNYDELHTLSRTNYNRTGYRFVGWNTTADGTGDFYEYGAQVKNLTDVDGEIVNLYAMWEALSYTVRFKLNGGEYVEYTSKTVTYDSPYGELPIPTRTGYTFTGWYTSLSSTGVLVTEETIVNRTVDHDLYAHWKVAEGYDLMATSPDAYITISIDDGDGKLVGDIYQTLLPVGTKVTIKANLNEGETRDFMFWRDDRMRIVSYSPEYTFVMEADKTIEAVYSEEAGSDYYTVVFVDSILKTVEDIQKVVKGGSATVPTLTTENAGYVFDRWDTDTSVVNDNLIVNAVYRPRNNIHTIKIVIGETVTESKYYYNTPVTAVITEEQIPDGQNFAGWTFDGKTIASYEKSFRFYVYKDLTVTAMFTTEEVVEKPTVILTTTIKEQTETTYKAEFMVTREVPEDYVFVSSGLLLTQSADLGTNENLTFESHSVEGQTAIRLYRTVHTTNDGQYQLTVKTSAGKTFYARGFVVYLDTASGELVTLYTDVVTTQATNG